MNPSSTRASWRTQISPVGIAIGCVGCVTITASSVYTALKMGALPWPTIFTSITSLVLLRAFGRTSLNEANVTQIIMSAGSMVAGGLAFTIPGIWMLGLAGEMSWLDMLVVALAGTLLGLACTALIRRRFVEESDLEYPVGTAAAQTLMASRAGAKTGRRLFGSMAVAGLWCALRDVAGVIPRMVLALPIPGVNFGLYNSPMLMSVGFLVGGAAVALWFAGALLANFGIIVGGSAAGLWDTTAAQGIVSSLGMGLMMGSGVGVVLRDILPKGLALTRQWGARTKDTVSGIGGHAVTASTDAHGNCGDTQTSIDADAGILGAYSDEALDADGITAHRAGSAPVGSVTRKKDEAGRAGHAEDRIVSPGILALFIASCALLVCFGLGLGAVPALVIVALAFVTTIMSAQSVGQTGIDPMEIFGLIVLLVVAALGESSQVKLFFVAGVVAVACGLAGDVMSDFKTGHILGTSPHAMWAGQAVGALIGVVVSIAVMYALLGAYGADAFGPGKPFVSAQASVVATMVSGIPSVAGFVVGLLAGVALYFLNIPTMMLGLGVYLPFYMSLSAALGAGVKVIYEHVCRTRTAKARTTSGADTRAGGTLTGDDPNARTARAPQDAGATSPADAEETTSEETGIIIASGVLGGESIIGVIIALASVAGGLLG